MRRCARRAGDAGQLSQDRCGVDELQGCDGDRGIRYGVRQWQAPGVGANEPAGDAGGPHHEHPGRQVHAQHSGTPTGQVIDESAGAAPDFDHLGDNRDADVADLLDQKLSVSDQDDDHPPVASGAAGALASDSGFWPAWESNSLTTQRSFIDLEISPECECSRDVSR